MYCRCGFLHPIVVLVVMFFVVACAPARDEVVHVIEEQEFSAAWFASQAEVVPFRTQNIEVAEAATINQIAVSDGGQVRAGDLLFDLNSFELDLQLSAVDKQIRDLEFELENLKGGGKEVRDVERTLEEARRSHGLSAKQHAVAVELEAMGLIPTSELLERAEEREGRQREIAYLEGLLAEGRARAVRRARDLGQEVTAQRAVKGVLEERRRALRVVAEFDGRVRMVSTRAECLDCALKVGDEVKRGDVLARVHSDSRAVRLFGKKHDLHIVSGAEVVVERRGQTTNARAVISDGAGVALGGGGRLIVPLEVVEPRYGDDAEGLANVRVAVTAHGWVVPRPFFNGANGIYLVKVQTGEGRVAVRSVDAFERDDGGLLVVNGVRPGDRLVVARGAGA